jgi:hypothetical protein
MASPGRYGPLPASDGPRTRDRDGVTDSAAAKWWLGTCPVCGTSVLVDDQFVRHYGRPLHVECDCYKLSRTLTG